MSDRQYEMTPGVEVDYGQRGEVPFADVKIESFIQEAAAAGCEGCANEACQLQGELGYINSGGLGDKSNTVASFTCVGCVEPGRIIEVGERFAELYDQAYVEAGTLQEQADVAVQKIADFTGH